MKTTFPTWLVAVVLVGCGGAGTVEITGDSGDAGAVAPGEDGGAPDAAVEDDAGLAVDAGMADAGAADAGVVDAGVADAGFGTISNRGVVNPTCPNDMAQLVAWNVPSRITTRWTKEASFTVRNLGSTTWSETDEVRFGTPGNSDPFASNGRVLLPAGVQVRPDPQQPNTYTFTFDLEAPDTAGTYVTNWQMVREHVCWFGDKYSATIVVEDPVATGVCADPVPPPISQMAAVVHIRGPTRITLDSTPKVCDRHYCRSIGFTDFRTCCPPRPEGHPDVDVCNEYVVGRAGDTGRVGPTWTFDGQLCGPTGPANCDNHPDNQFLLWVFGPGTARACSASGVCGTVGVQ